MIGSLWNNLSFDGLPGANDVAIAALVVMQIASIPR